MSKSIEVYAESNRKSENEEQIDSKTPLMKTEQNRLHCKMNQDIAESAKISSDLETNNGMNHSKENENSVEAKMAAKERHAETLPIEKRVIYEDRIVRLKVIEENTDSSKPLPEGSFILKGKLIAREEISQNKNSNK